MELSRSGELFIQGHEGYSLTWYPDSAQLPTIGYGHLILPDEQWMIETGIDDETANALFRNDIKWAVTCVNKNVNVHLSQNEFDALVSFTFNVGCKAFKDSTLLRKLNAGDRAGAACQFIRWVYVTVGGVKKVIGGLKSRRLSEQRLFYGSNPPCVAEQPETPSSIVENTPNRPNTPPSIPAYPERKLRPPEIKEMEQVDSVRKQTGKIPSKKGFRVQRLGDKNLESGIIAKTSTSGVFVNGRPISTDGSLVVGSPPKHPANTANGSRKVFVNKRRVNFETNLDTNLLPRAGGSNDTFTR